MIDYLLKINPLLLTLIFSCFTFLVTALGSSCVFIFKKTNKSIEDAMLSISAGIMISASFFSLLSPAINLSNEQHKCTFLVVSIGFILGSLFLYLSDKILDNLYNKKDKNKKRNLLLFSSITLHNIPEGLAIGCAFGELFINTNKSILLSAIVLAIGIGIQNFPEGSAISLPLWQSGMSKFKSFIYGSLSAIVEPISAIISSIISIKVKNVLPLFLTFAAGAMIYVSTKELIPESQTNNNKSLMTMFLIIGFVIMMILDVALN